MKREALVINTYAGSLLIGCKKAGYNVTASYEDSGYGTPLQRKNFPGLQCLESFEQWNSSLDLTDKVIIAHPPCACFSAMTNAAVTGTDSPKFVPTLRLLEYTHKTRPAALVYESVPAAIPGAWSTHDAFAKDNGYSVHRLLFNYDAWVPQDRVRAWFVFLRKDVFPNRVLYLHPQPRLRPSLQNVLGDSMVGVPLPRQVKELERVREYLGKWISQSEITAYFSGEHGYGLLPAVLRKPGNAFAGVDLMECAKRCGRPYLRYNPYIVDPEASKVGVLMGITFLLYKGRLLGDVEYKRIMGYPDDYDLTLNANGNVSTYEPREWLSRGVVPAAAAWVLQGVFLTSLFATNPSLKPSTDYNMCEDGNVLNLSGKPIPTTYKNAKGEDNMDLTLAAQDPMAEHAMREEAGLSDFDMPDLDGENDESTDCEPCKSGGDSEPCGGDEGSHEPSDEDGELDFPDLESDSANAELSGMEDPNKIGGRSIQEVVEQAGTPEPLRVRSTTGQSNRRVPKERESKNSSAAETKEAAAPREPKPPREKVARAPRCLGPVYFSARLTFKRKVVEALPDDGVFQCHTPEGVFSMTRAQFFEHFPGVAASKSFKDLGTYTYSSVPEKARKFIVAEASHASETGRMTETQPAVQDIPRKKRGKAEPPVASDADYSEVFGKDWL